MNAISRVFLYTCVIAMETGDWMCDACGRHNFKYRKICFGCDKTRDSELGITNQPVISIKSDWRCGCGELNFANRTRCRKCPKQRNGAVLEFPVIPNHKDWTCPNTKCAEVNFKHREVCRKCTGPKPSILAPDVQQKSTNGECVVCLERPKTHMITHCRHLCCCEVCGFAMNSCPICRHAYNPDTDLMHVYNV